MGLGRPFRDLPLFWKLLLPYLALVLVVGAVDTYVVLRELAIQNQAALNQDLAQRILDARSGLHDQELYAEEGASFAANVDGMSGALQRGDSGAAATLLRSVAALKPRLQFIAVARPDGTSIADLAGAGRLVPGAGTRLGGQQAVREALNSTDGASRSGFVQVGGIWLLGVAEPICGAGPSCRPVGVAVAGVGLRGILASAGTDESAAIFSADGVQLAHAGPNLLRQPASRAASAATSLQAGLATVYSPITFQGRDAGTLAVGVPTAASAAAIHDAAVRLVLLLLAAMAAMVLVGWWIARFLLGQLQPLLATSRALGSGDLAARAPVLSADEHGELALVINRMAEQLQASHENLESQVRQRTAEIERLLGARTELFAGLSHELRTPLAVILAQTELLELLAAGHRNGATPTSIARTVRLSTTQVLDVVNEILDLARAEVGGVSVTLEPIEVDDIFAGLRPTVDGLCGGAGLRARFQSSRLRAMADREELTQAVLNLVENAVKYTPTGGTVTVEAATESGQVRISVSDTGIGIPDDVGTKVFEPFYRVPGVQPQRGQPASGLGLALTRKLVEAQGGRIGFDPRPEGGTTFWISLPEAN